MIYVTACTVTEISITVVADVVLVIMYEMVAERMLAGIIFRTKFRRAVRSLSRVPRCGYDTLPNLLWTLYLFHWNNREEPLFKYQLEHLLHVDRSSTKSEAKRNVSWIPFENVKVEILQNGKGGSLLDVNRKKIAINSVLTYKVGGVVMRQQGKSYRGEKPANIRGGAVIRHLAPAQQKKLTEAVKHPGTGLMHCHHDAFTLLFSVLLQPWNQRLCRVRVQPARWFLPWQENSF